MTRDQFEAMGGTVVTSKYYHGGQKGLRAGAMILPPSVTDAKQTLYEYGTSIVSRKNCVYVTTSYAAALMFAAMHPSGGGIYEVQPEGEMTPDPDCDWPGISWECDRARIVVARDVSNRTRNKVRRALMRPER